jgi:hypothetical protein
MNFALTRNWLRKYAIEVFRDDRLVFDVRMPLAYMSLRQMMGFAEVLCTRTDHKVISGSKPKSQMPTLTHTYSLPAAVKIQAICGTRLIRTPQMVTTMRCVKRQGMQLTLTFPWVTLPFEMEDAYFTWYENTDEKLFRAGLNVMSGDMPLEIFLDLALDSVDGHGRKSLEWAIRHAPEMLQEV